MNNYNNISHTWKTRSYSKQRDHGHRKLSIYMYYILRQVDCVPTVSSNTVTWIQEYQTVYQGMLLFIMGVKSRHGICVMLSTILDIYTELMIIL